jgi:diadenosine tetraphosphatase ApaH/serine/threonine PP2A family protein phosphatase
LRYAVLGDIHGNIYALEAVLEAIKKDAVDSILCIGDLVGYGANPKECIQSVREHVRCVVAGNHDFAVAGKLDASCFNPEARIAVNWTRERLSEEEKTYLAELSLTDAFDGVSLVHSTPYHPEDFFYVQTLLDAALAFSSMETKLAFVGHSHVPVVFVNSKPVDFFLRAEFDVPDSAEMIVNVGSVGQPRDLDPRACYAMLDTDQRMVFMRRVEYDVRAAAEAILAGGLPVGNANRLVIGC